MDYFCLIQSVVSYVENRSKTGLDPKRLETAMGVSYAHLRAVFRERTSIPLGRYALSRRVSNAAFKMVHGSSSILDLALEYGFGNHDSFTRAFKRMTGLTPSQFRAQGGTVGRTKLTGGIYGPSIQGPETVCLPPLRTEDMMNGKEMKRENGSCILYGVPKVAYRYEECTPFPSCLKACLNYMGQELSYAWLMAASGAAFRLRWNTRCWDGGNVDIMMIYDSPTEAFERSFRAAGRSHRFLGRNGGSVKVEFVDFITAEIDQGRPVIALGIIGPPEACIITGYRDGGQTLLGWNFFQENRAGHRQGLARSGARIRRRDPGR